MKIKRHVLILIFVTFLVVSLVMATRNDSTPEPIIFSREVVVRSQFWHSLFSIKSSHEHLGILLKINLNGSLDSRNFILSEVKRPSSECFKLTLDDCSTLKVLKYLDSAKQKQESGKNYYTLTISKADAVSLEILRAFRVDNSRYKLTGVPVDIEELKLAYKKLGGIRSEENSQL